MTAIIAIKKGKKIFVGADGGTIQGEYTFSGFFKETKIVPVLNSDNCFIVGTGSCRSIDVVSYIPFLLDGKSDVSFSYVVNKVVPRIFDALKRNNLLKENQRGSYMDPYFLLVTKRHLFLIEDEGEVIEIPHVVIIGSGNAMLLCKYLESKKEKMDNRDRVISCLEHAIQYGCGIRYPISFATNESNRIEIIEKEEKIRI